MIDAEFPGAFDFLFDPPHARYRVAHGGRGSGKSHSFAAALLIQGTQTKHRVLCCRELQRSIADSVHRLLSDKIADLGLSDFYRIEKASIEGANGTEFIFSGLKNSASLKSYEQITICWVEEGQTVSKASWELLIPTIRAENSEIWVSMNPLLPTDNSYERWVINPPPNALVRQVNYPDNPFFPEVLRKEMEYCKERDPDLYNHVWLGCPVSMLAGAIYAQELRLVDAENRICRVPYDPTRPVDCYWDLGYGDLSAVWMAQPGPFEYRLIDYFENSGKTIEWYIKEFQLRGYQYGYDYLPWDIGLHATQMGSGRSIEELLRRAGRKVRIVPKLSVADGINAARTIFPLCWFDRERCADGIQALRHYRYGEIEKQGIPTRVPVHDMSSHGADAFRMFSVTVKPPGKPPASQQSRPPREAMTTWS